MMGVVASGDPTATGCADWVWGCVRSGNRWCLTDGQGRLACLSELVDRPGGVSYDWQGDSGLAVLELHDERDIRFKDEVTRACVEAARRIGDWDGDDGLRAVCFCPAGQGEFEVQAQALPAGFGVDGDAMDHCHVREDLLGLLVGRGIGSQDVPGVFNVWSDETGAYKAAILPYAKDLGVETVFVRDWPGREGHSQWLGEFFGQQADGCVTFLLRRYWPDSGSSRRPGPHVSLSQNHPAVPGLPGRAVGFLRLGGRRSCDAWKGAGS